MKIDLPKPNKKTIFYEDKKLYACLANHPIVKGHTIVIWKTKVSDLHLLKNKDYKHLMNIVDKVRNAMLKTLKIKKVYLVYMDETKHVHWHLIPRYNTLGFNIFREKPKKLKKFSLVKKFKKNINF